MEQKIIDKCIDMGAEYCDIRIERKVGTSIEVKDRELKKAIPGEEEGASIRVLYKGAWGFHSTNEISEERLNEALERAFKLAKASSEKVKDRVKLGDVKVVSASIVWKPKIDPKDISIEEKHELLADMDKAIHEIKEIHTVTTGYGDSTIEKKFFSSEGSEISSKVTRTFAQVNLIAKENGKITDFRARVGGTSGFEIFKIYSPIEKGVEAAQSAVRVLRAKHSPSGRFPVIADPDLTGVFIHEALGHCTEADLVIAGDSILEGKIGERIGAEIVTIYDDPTIENAFGSYPFDDEGVRGQKKVLVENGILKNFIHSRESAFKLAMHPNGGARAESYAVHPHVRMSNTMLEPGEHTFEELVEDIKFGVYAKGSRGGQVDTAKGSFQFSALEAFLIENGEITKPLKDVALSGATLEILSQIDAIGKTQEFGTPGFCGKGGQLVPVGDGGPHIRIKEAIVGGMQ